MEKYNKKKKSVVSRSSGLIKVQRLKKGSEDRGLKKGAVKSRQMPEKETRGEWAKERWVAQSTYKRENERHAAKGTWQANHRNFVKN